MSDDLFDIFNEDLAPASVIASTSEVSPLQIDEANAAPQRNLSATVASAITPADKASGDDVELLDDPDHTAFPTSSTLNDSSLGESATPSPASNLSSAPPPIHSHQQPPSQSSQRVGEPVTTAITPPLPLPFDMMANAVPSATTGNSGAVMIIRSSPATAATTNGNTAGDKNSKTVSSPPPAAAVFTEAHSRIRVRRATVALEQLTVRLAEFPYAPFSLFRQTACRNGGQTPVPLTCVGVVTRKSDPKQSSTQTRASRYAVLTLWSMESISPSPETEISFLLCGDAFDLLYSQLVRGSVMALSNVAMCPRKGGGSTSNSSSTSSTSGAAASGDVLLRVSDHTAVRQLGFAADLGTCSSVSQKSNERCHVVVNTLYSQHCSYHVGDLRKVARGTHSSNSSSGLNAHHASASATPLMKGGALTSHMTLTPAAAARRGHTLPPGTASASTQRGVNAGGPSSVLSLRPPQPASSAVPNARLAASQQLLRQPAFFAVRGATGLPVEDAALRRGVNSAGSGVYGGVQSGAPLPLKQQIGLRPAAKYPTAQELGVTSRGREVLEAARQQAVLSEEEKLLRRSLKPSTQKVSASTTAVTSAAPSRGEVGNPKVSLTSAARVRERALEKQPPNPAVDSVVTAAKRARTELATSSAASMERTKNVSPTEATAVPPRPRPPPTSTTPDAQRIEALRAQFQPLHRTTPAAFTPLSGQAGVHSVIASAVQKDYRHSVVLSGAGGDAKTALLRAAAVAAKEVTKAKPSSSHTASGDSKEKINAVGEAVQSTGALVSAPASQRGETGEAPLPLTLLGTVASEMQSAHDHLRGEANRQRLLSFVDKQITKEKALEALEAVTQQEIKAYYCYGCRRWYAKPPTSCVEQHHRTELKAALKKYIKCEHCSYKTFVIGGEDAKGWKVFPRCPRCHEASFWVRGDAAPQVAGPVEEPAPD